jgi:hypothetical protein
MGKIKTKLGKIKAEWGTEQNGKTWMRMNDVCSKE